MSIATTAGACGVSAAGTKTRTPSCSRTRSSKLARKAGIEKRVHAHGLRHTHAAELMREGVRLNVIQKQLGHASVGVTSAYLDHIAPREVVETMKKREWRLE